MTWIALRWRSFSNSEKLVLLLLLFLVMMVTCALCGTIGYTLYAQSSPEQVSTPIAPSTTVVSQDDSWTRVKNAGSLVVGTSADYPPFVAYDGNFQMTGFDVALMQKIGEKLGVQVQFKDMAFDGLPQSLLLSQVDAAIGAISDTPEREQQIAFSNVYLVGSDAILAQADAKIQAIHSMDDMATYHVGVQAASVYQGWLEKGLVQTGKMPQDNLVVYTQVDQAISDLRQKRLDLVVVDGQPAQAAVKQGGVKIAASGLNRQLYAIAFKPNSNSLKGMIDQALTELQQENVVAQLAKQYLGLNPDQIPPTPTPWPTQTLAPIPTAQPAGCKDGMAFVKDLTYPDFAMTNPPQVLPGALFTKGWRLQNIGNCTWNNSYRLIYVGGSSPYAQMGGQPAAILGQVAPGGMVDVFNNFAAPLLPGVYQGFWELRDSSNRSLGQRLWVGIRVPQVAPPTPRPTPTAIPGVQFTANQTKVSQGDAVQFNWNARGAKQVYFYAQGSPWIQQPVANPGSDTQYPQSTTTYLLHVVYPDNRVIERPIQVQVYYVEKAPHIQQFSLTPDYQITDGQCVSVEWNVTGAADEITVARNTALLRQKAPLNDSLQDCPPGPGDYTYSIHASGPGGEAHDQSVLHVGSPLPVITPTPEPHPIEQPVIDFFQVEPSEIEVQQCVNISWRASGGSQVARLFRNNQLVLDNAPLVYNLSDCLDTPGGYEYRLQATNANGDSVSQSALVTVQPPLLPTEMPGPVWPTEGPVWPTAEPDWPTPEPLWPTEEPISPTEEPFGPVDPDQPMDISWMLVSGVALVGFASARPNKPKD